MFYTLEKAVTIDQTQGISDRSLAASASCMETSSIHGAHLGCNRRLAKLTMYDGSEGSKTCLLSRSLRWALSWQVSVAWLRGQHIDTHRSLLDLVSPSDTQDQSSLVEHVSPAVQNRKEPCLYAAAGFLCMPLGEAPRVDGESKRAEE